MGSRKAVNAQDDSERGFSATCLAPPFQALNSALDKSTVAARPIQIDDVRLPLGHQA
jgi:hypothetical protein